MTAGSKKARPIARLRLARVAQAEMTAPARREGPPVFHVFEELYARTVREMERRACASRSTVRSS